MYITVCRFCLRTDRTLLEIDEKLEDFFKDLSNNMVIENCSMKLCAICAYLLKKFYNFQQKCIKANEILNEHISRKSFGPTKDLHKLLDSPNFNITTVNMRQFNIINSCFEPYIKQEDDYTISNPIPSQKMCSGGPNNYKSTKTTFLRKNLGENGTLDESYLADDMQLIDLKIPEDPIIHNKDNFREDIKMKEENTYLGGYNIADNSFEINEMEKLSKLRNNIKTAKIATRPRLRKHPLKNFKEYKTIFEIQLFESDQDARSELEQRKMSEPYINAEHKCDICYTVYKYAKLLEFHKRWHDPATGEAECDICQMRFASGRAVTKHKNSAHNGKFMCKKCPMTTYHTAAMHTHYRQHLDVPISCKLCGRTFKNPSTHKTHLRLRHKTEHVCVTCARSFVSEFGLLQHRKLKHKTKSLTDSGATAYCEPCNLMFANEQVYVIHLKNTEKHSTLAESIIACKICGERYGSEEEIKEHSRKQHTRLNRTTNTVRTKDSHICPECGVVLGGSHRWKFKHMTENHPDSKHTAELKRNRPYMCDTCGKCYTSVYTLRDHINSHTGAKPYACTQCSARFPSSANLGLHKERHNPAKRECKRCGKKFVSSSELSNHMRSHIQDRRYKCTICHKDFIHASSLRVHISGVHNNVRRVRKQVKRETDGT